MIAKALEMDGFPADSEGKSVMVGFARNTVLGVADKVIEAVKGGAIKHFFLVGGCDDVERSVPEKEENRKGRCCEWNCRMIHREIFGGSISEPPAAPQGFCLS